MISALITLIEESNGDIIQFMNPIIEKLGQAFNIYQVGVYNLLNIKYKIIIYFNNLWNLKDINFLYIYIYIYIFFFFFILNDHRAGIY